MIFGLFQNLLYSFVILDCMQAEDTGFQNGQGCRRIWALGMAGERGMVMRDLAIISY